MVVRTRTRAVLTALALYVLAGLLVGYFGYQAFNGNRGLKANQDLQAQIAELSSELGRLRIEKGEWTRRVNLLRSASLDPDMLDERARAMLDYVHPRDLVLVRKGPAAKAMASVAAAR